jgi:hypothetical protein
MSVLDNVLFARRYIIAVAIVFCLIVNLLWSRGLAPLVQHECTFSPRHNHPSLNFPSIPQKRQNIADMSGFGFHHDVYMALVWTMERVMQTGSVEVYADTPFGYDFQSIVDQFGLYHGVFHPPQDFIPAIRNNTGDGGIDLVVLGTCEIEYALHPFCPFCNCLTLLISVCDGSMNRYSRLGMRETKPTNSWSCA